MMSLAVITSCLPPMIVVVIGSKDSSDGRLNHLEKKKTNLGSKKTWLLPNSVLCSLF